LLNFKTFINALIKNKKKKDVLKLISKDNVHNRPKIDILFLSLNCYSDFPLLNYTNKSFILKAFMFAFNVTLTFSSRLPFIELRLRISMNSEFESSRLHCLKHLQT